jgi:hypothetical protein
MFNIIVGAGAVGAGAASRYGSGSYQKMRLLAASAPQHWSILYHMYSVLYYMYFNAYRYTFRKRQILIFKKDRLMHII